MLSKIVSVVQFLPCWGNNSGTLECRVSITVGRFAWIKTNMIVTRIVYVVTSSFHTKEASIDIWSIVKKKYFYNDGLLLKGF